MTIAVVEGSGNQLITEEGFTTFGTDPREGFLYFKCLLVILMF